MHHPIPGIVSSGRYTTTGMLLGNGTDYYSRTDWLPSDGGDMTFVAALKFDSILSGSTFYLGGNVGSNRMIMELVPLDASNHQIGWNRLNDTSGVALLGITAKQAILDTIMSGWFSYAETFRSSTGAWEVWINGVKASGTGTPGTADWTGPSLFGAWFAGDSAGLWMNAAHVWVANEYVDMTSKYSSFFNSSNVPIGLGSDGSKPTGRQPEHFAPGGDLSTNLGTESNWTPVGSPVASSTSPTD